MCVCVCVSASVYVFVCKRRCLHMCVCACELWKRVCLMRVFLCVYICESVYVYVYVFVKVCMCMCLWKCVCVCVCESVYMCMCMCLCMCRSPKDQPWCMAVTTRNSDAGPFCAGVSAAPHKSLTALLFFLHRLLSSEILTLTRKGLGPRFFAQKK